MIDEHDPASAWYAYDVGIRSRPLYMRYRLLSKDAGVSASESLAFYAEMLGAMRQLEGGLDLFQVRVVGESLEIAGWEAALEACLTVGLFRKEGEVVISPFIEETLSKMNQKKEHLREIGRKGRQSQSQARRTPGARTGARPAHALKTIDIDKDIDIDIRDNIPPLPPTGGGDSLEPDGNEFRGSGKPGSGVAPAEGESQDSREPQSRGASAPGWDGTPDGVLFPDAPPPAAKPAKKTRQVLNAAQSVEFEQVLSRWNAQGREVVHVRAPTDFQRRRFRDLRKVYSLDDILATIEKIKINPFHTDTKAADLHWFLLPEKFEMVAAYRPREPEAKNTGVKAPSWARGVFDESKYEKPYQPPDQSIYE